MVQPSGPTVESPISALATGSGFAIGDVVPLTVKIENAQPRVDGFARSMFFKVSTVSNLANFKTNGVEFSVIRQFSDFEWLRKKLTEQYPGCFVAPLPEKRSLDFISQEAIREWMTDLQAFLRRVVSHTSLHTSGTLQIFLECSDEELKSAQKEPGLSPFVNMFKSLQRNVSTLISGASAAPKTSVDSWFQQTDDYIAKLSQYFSALAKAANLMSKRQTELSQTYTLMAEDVQQLVALESSKLSGPLSQFNGASARSSHELLQHAKKAIGRFEKRIGGYVANIGAAREITTARAEAARVRDAAWTQHQQLDAKLQKLVPTNPAPKKLEAAGIEVQQARDAHAAAVIRVDEISARGAAELHQFVAEKTMVLKEAMQDFAQMQIDLGEQIASLWKNALPELDSMQAPNTPAAAGGANIDESFMPHGGFELARTVFSPLAAQTYSEGSESLKLPDVPTDAPSISPRNTAADIAVDMQAVVSSAPSPAAKITTTPVKEKPVATIPTEQKKTASPTTQQHQHHEQHHMESVPLSDVQVAVASPVQEGSAAMTTLPQQQQDQQQQQAQMESVSLSEPESNDASVSAAMASGEVPKEDEIQDM
eukprot:TRINITY_DN5967_c0_g1_i1.p1 TRINITY_DN5967_c0_g1~~TRINITY_DN5967_c0_g1_i1.p1  ORF type:complete len:596 (+),score=165.85 TRINITY_DN5967_c0_g1_i1:1231-3018(+)